MIGGTDVPIPTRAGDWSMEVAVRAIRQHWPRAVFENGLTGDRYDQFLEVPFGAIEEIFVYRDAEAADAWDEHGAIPELSNTMIHLLADDGTITAVIDERDTSTEQILEAIASGLSDPILCLGAA